MPQHSSGVLQHADKDTDECTFLLDGRTSVSLLYTEELAKLAKARETPVTLLRDEAMMCVCDIVSECPLRSANGHLRLTVYIVGSWGLEMTSAN